VVEEQEDGWSFGDCSTSELSMEVVARQALTNRQLLIWMLAAEFCGAGLNHCGRN